MERGILAGLAAYRWAAWAWMATVLLLSATSLVHPTIALTLVAAAFVFTAVATGLLRSHHHLLVDVRMAAPEVALGALLTAADGFVYGPGHAFSVSQSLGVAWPLAGVMAAGVAGGRWTGLGAGVAMGAARAVAAVANGVRDFGSEQVLSLLTTSVLYVLAGVVAGHVVDLLRRAEREISAARAREEVARDLHDGVLQTLALIGRRATDPALARMAKDQERGLRDYLAGLNARHDGTRSLLAELRSAAARFEQTYRGRVEVVVADDLRIGSDVAGALSGAVGETLVNAGKHGRAGHVNVFVEPDGRGVFCSVRDDGAGFDPASTPEGLGLRESVRGRVEGLGGRVEIDSRPGRATEVRMWIP